MMYLEFRHDPIDDSIEASIREIGCRHKFYRDHLIEREDRWRVSYGVMIVITAGKTPKVYAEMSGSYCELQPQNIHGTRYALPPNVEGQLWFDYNRGPTMMAPFPKLERLNKKPNRQRLLLLL